MVFLPHWPSANYRKNIEKSDTHFKKLKEFVKTFVNFDQIPPIIHIAGTNGKGSTASFIKSIFEYSGYKVHLYTSPHLVEFNERIILSGEKISDDFLYELLEIVRFHSQSLDFDLGFFEATSFAAFLAFSKIQADVVILETGIGGLLDVTNIIENPIVSVITPISFDHMNVLGNSLDKIALQKAGIIKTNCKSVFSIQNPIALEVLINVADQRNSANIAYGYDYAIESVSNNEFLFKSIFGENTYPKPSLEGDHQILNASTAIASVKFISDKFHFSDDKISIALKNTFWPGRLQKFDVRKIVRNSKNYLCYLDGAHNIDSAKILSIFIEKNLTGKIYIICGLTKNRNIKDFFSQFLSLNLKKIEICCVRVESEASSYLPEYIEEDAKKLGFFAKSFDNIEEIILYINENSAEDEANIVVTGSLYLIGDFLKKSISNH